MQISLFESVNCQLINGTNELMKLNVGCGSAKIDGYINIDASVNLNADAVFDIRRGMPYPDNSVEEILFFHAIEHIEEKYHQFILEEFWRVLIPGGNVLISYPEFEKVATNYIENYRGMRTFWKNTIYGLQRYPGDYHVSLMDSEILAVKLQEIGFIDIEWKAEPQENYNSILKAIKGAAFPSYEDMFAH